MIFKNTILRNKLKNLAKKFPEVEDILLFGSVVRGKVRPADIDIMVLFKKAVNKNAEYKIRKELEKYYKNISIISKTKNSVIEPTFDARESILFEGISLISRKNLAKQYGFDSLGMFKYDLKKLNNTGKTKFYYALNGRSGSQGILDILNGIKLSDNIIFTNIDKIEPMKEFLDSWKINYIYTPLLIPNRMNNKKILQ